MTYTERTVLLFVAGVLLFGILLRAVGVTGPHPPLGGNPSLEQPCAAVDINNASHEELVRIPHIGDVMAERIIQYRRNYGPIRTYDDLLNVKGIGPKKLARIKSFIVIFRGGGE